MEQPDLDRDPARATLLLARASAGDDAAAEELLPLVYAELRSLARRYMGSERDSHTLQPTALVNEAWLKLDQASGAYEGRAHFFRAAARAMRQVLVDHARARRTDKRGGESRRVPLDAMLERFEESAVDLLSLDEALGHLAEADEELARIVELRFFGGFTIPETAELVGLSRQAVERRWRAARLWLHGRLGSGG